MTTKRGSLPPPPMFPPRKLTPPARKAVKSGTWRLDEDTPAKNELWLCLQSFAQVAESVSPGERHALVELAALFAELDSAGRQALIVVARGLVDRRT